VAKLLIIPGVCVMELLWFNRNLTPAMWAAVAVVVCGVAVV
jgi:multidrug transporter EmrE-like cation transporter